MFNAPFLVESVYCPLCQRPVAPGQFAAARDIEPAAISFIQNRYAGWQPEQGSCSNCLQNVLAQILEQAASGFQTSFYGIVPVNLRLGYSSAFDGSGVTIAFLDSGFACHPDLEGRIKLYVDASQPEIRELAQVESAGDLSWHGTMTSVVACGNGSLSGGLYRGLASGAQVVLIRVSDSDGRVNEETIGRGLEWLLANARRYGIQIVNISLGGDRPQHSPDHPLNLMVDALVAQGLLVVCAAGNEGERWLRPPASAASAVTVGGLDDKNTLDPTIYEQWHSNYGLTFAGIWKPELVAPSLWLAAPVLPDSQVAQEALILEELLQADDAQLPALLQSKIGLLHLCCLPNNLYEKEAVEIKQILWQAWRSQKLINPYYQHVDGTSFAAPIVSSVAAQMWQANPTLSPLGLKDLLLRTARYLPQITPGQQGHGVVDPWAAVVAALATAIPVHNSTPSYALG
jgi:serine protease AprX